MNQMKMLQFQPVWAHNVRLRLTTALNLQSDEVYADLQSRRKLDEDLRPMFDTGFWKYPGSEETLPVQEGGLEGPC